MFQTPCHRQDHEPPDMVLDQVAQSSNMVLNTSRVAHSISGSLFYHLTSLSEEFPPDIKSKPK